MKRIAVYCGSSPGVKPVYLHAARRMGEELARRGISLVFGGGRIGLMGEIASAAFNAGGEVIGVIPQDLLAKEIGSEKVSEMHVLSTMHERKAYMLEISHGFIALPGGFGTFEEIFEALTWAQLQIHSHPCGFLNVNNYFDPLVYFLDRAVDDGFIRIEHRQMISLEDDPGLLLDRFSRYTPPTVDKAAWAQDLLLKPGGDIL